MNRPETVEGLQVWDLACRLGGQLRVIPWAVIGLDLTAAFAMADALGVERLAVAELLPDVEAAMVEVLNKRLSDSRGREES